MIRRGHEYKDKNDVLRVINDPRNNVKFVRILYPDILGRLMDFTIPASETVDVLNNGKIFDGSSINGNSSCVDDEFDLKIIPDPKSMRLLPWTYKGQNENTEWKEVVMFGDIYTPEGEQFSGDSRFILKNLLQKAKDAFAVDNMYISPQIEFFLLNQDKDLSSLDDGGYFFSGENGIVRKEIQLLLNEMGIETEYDHHEFATSQHEIDLKYKDAIDMADSCMLFRYVAKRVARTHGLYASFMPKIIDDVNGSGLHLYQSLWSKGKNMFYDDKDRYQLSSVARKYIAGLIRYGSQISLVTNQFVNSYKRLQPGFRAPTYKTWGRRHKAAYIRIPEKEKGRENQINIELRSPDSACNFYLAFAMMLSAGLQGVKENLELDDPFEKDIDSLSSEELEKLSTLPGNFSEAINEAKHSKLLKLSLGQYIYTRLISAKEKELEEYDNAVRAITEGHEKEVSSYELKKFLHWL
jgi:glutamine synthetase